jgi:tyrosine-protein phosphatase YwqE
MDKSIDIIKNLQNIGFKKLIITPHIMMHRFPNNPSIIKSNFLLLEEEVKKENIDIELNYAAEYYYDEHFLEFIEKKELLTFGDNYVLFEFSYTTKPLGLESTIKKLIEAGYKPLLAHPERYSYFNTEEDYRHLKNMGLYLQINLNSTNGFYGKKVKKSVEKIINMGIVDFVGSDIHGKKYSDCFQLSLEDKIYKKIMNTNTIKNNYL